MADGRIARPRPDDLDPRQRALYEEITGGARAGRPGASSLVDAEGRLEGPFNAFLLQPELGHVLQAVGGALRYGTSLDARLREVAILVVAAVRDAPFEQHVHEPIARELGLTDAQVAGLRRGEFGLLDPDATQVARAVAQMIREGDLDDAAYAALVELLGEAQVLELTAVVGYYAMLALQLKVFRVAVPDQGH